jgi:hypothetical protein
MNVEFTKINHNVFNKSLFANSSILKMMKNGNTKIKDDKNRAKT